MFVLVIIISILSCLIQMKSFFSTAYYSNSDCKICLSGNFFSVSQLLTEERSVLIQSKIPIKNWDIFKLTSHLEQKIGNRYRSIFFRNVWGTDVIKLLHLKNFKNTKETVQIRLLNLDYTFVLSEDFKSSDYLSALEANIVLKMCNQLCIVLYSIFCVTFFILFFSRLL